MSAVLTGLVAAVTLLIKIIAWAVAAFMALGFIVLAGCVLLAVVVIVMEMREHWRVG